MSGLQVAFYDGGAVCFQDAVMTGSGQPEANERAILPLFLRWLVVQSTGWPG